MSDVLDVKKRSESGTQAAKRLRTAGRVPGVLYGHGQETVSVSVATDQLHSAVRHGGKVVDLRGDLTEKALITEVQWDTYGQDLLHFDLLRIDAGERVNVTVALELRGEAPGTKEGGVVELISHEVEIECPADVLPDKFEININDLHVNESIKMSDIELPAGATLLSPEDAIVVTCNEVVEELEEEGVAETMEPELIGRKPEDEDDQE